MLFVIHTPYHLYQSLKFLGTQSRKFVFVVYMPEKVLNTFSTVLSELSRDHKVIIRKRGSTRLSRLIKNRFDIKVIMDALDDLSYDELAVFHDGQLISQAVMAYSLARYGQSFKISLIEDGTATYILRVGSSEDLDSLSLPLSLLLKRFWWGVDFKPSTYHGFSKEIKTVYLSQPELYLNSGKEVLQRPLERIEARYLDWIGISCEPDSALFLIDYSISPSYTDKYLSVVKKQIESLLSRGRKIYIKFHPAETNFHILDLLGGRITILPSELGAEFIVEKNFDKNLKIVGNASSSLLSLSKEWDVYCNYIDLDEKLEHLYKSCFYIKEFEESKLQC